MQTVIFAETFRNQNPTWRIAVSRNHTLPVQFIFFYAYFHEGKYSYKKVIFL
jgi:hypothetical protein